MMFLMMKKKRCFSTVLVFLLEKTRVWELKYGMDQDGVVYAVGKKLINKCLVELDENNHIKMHDHLRDLGREIANQHSPYRIWSSQQNMNTEKHQEKITGIRGIKTIPSNMISWIFPGTRKSHPVMNDVGRASSNYEFMASAIGRDWSFAPSLVVPKLLVIRGDYFIKAIGQASRELVWLRWFEIGQRNLPSQLSLKNLRVLELYENVLPRKHQLKELWKGDSNAPVQLRELVISECTKFQRFPDSIGRLNMLKKIVVIDGYNLRSLPEEFGRLRSLEYLKLWFCHKLSSLPDSFGNLGSLQFLDLTGCSKLRMLPFSFRKLKLLQYLKLSSCERLVLRAEEFQNITKLEYVDFTSCIRLQELPCHITKQVSLRKLKLLDTESLRELPINIGELSELRRLTIQCSLSTSLPTSLGNLSSLTTLLINKCSNLESLPTSLGNLSFLTTLHIICCHSLKSLPTSIGDLFSLTSLAVWCYGLEALPNTLGNLSSLRQLIIIDCGKLKCLPLSVKRLNSLEYLEVENCPVKVDFGAALFTYGLSNLKEVHLNITNVRRISMSEDRYPCLERLHLNKNDHLTEIKSLPSTVKSIILQSCGRLKKIRVPCDLVNLESLLIKSCPELEELPSFVGSACLREFEVIDRCCRIQKIEGLENCARLERLETSLEVPGLQSLEHMKKLRSVNLKASKRSDVERCIQTMKKWPNEIRICGRAVPEASSLLHSLLSQNIVVVDSFSNRKIQCRPKLRNTPSSNDNELIMLCFVINCVTSQLTPSLSVGSDGCILFDETLPRVEKGRWVWVGVFAADWSSGVDEFIIERDFTSCGERGEVENGLFARREEETVMEAFLSLLPLFQS